ncbi:MAG: hypothetical protein JXM71_02300 [Spirochaetales bacterium]|nr:hypothetical protein [Spirochaetales bacterium]
MPNLAYVHVLLPLIAYLVARALLSRYAQRIGTAVPGVLTGCGAILALLLPGQPTGAAFAFVIDALGAIALAAAGFEAGRTMPPRKSADGSAARTLRRSIAFFVPAITGMAVALGFGFLYNAPLATMAGAALTLAAALWLCVEPGVYSLAAAGIALILARAGQFPEATTVAWSIGVAMAILAMGGALSRSAAQASGAFMAAATIALAWAAHSAGAPWPAAGLAAGFAVGLARGSALRGISARRSVVLAPLGVLGPGAGFIVIEAAYALAFIAGLSLAPRALATLLPVAFAVAGAAVAASALRGLLSGEHAVSLPSDALAVAALLSFSQADILGDAAIAGFALAYVVSAPFVRGASVVRTGAPAETSIKAVIGVSGSDESVSAVSFAAAIGGSGEPVRVACVAATSGNQGPSLAEAEEALVRCVVAGASEGIRVLPSVISAASVAAGLARSAMERQADAILLGTSVRQKQGAEEQHAVLSETLEAFQGTVIALSRPKRFASAGRLVAVAVSSVEKTPEFERALVAIARVWGRPTRTMDGLIIGGQAEALADAASGMLDPRAIVSVQSWRDVPAALSSLGSRSPGFVVFTARPGTASWNPGHERLPVVLAGAFPESPVALWFAPVRGQAETAQNKTPPSSRAPEEPHPDAWPPLLSAAYDSGRVLQNMPEEALVDAIRRLTDTMFPTDKVASGRLATAFSAIARKEPIELAPGVLLLHAHADGVALPTLAIGSNPGGWPLVALSSPVRITVILVSPSAASAESHLEALTQIAMAFRNLDLAGHLLGA